MDRINPLTLAIAMALCSGGSSGDIPLLSVSEWNNLTEAQKKSYDLVAIQNADDGYYRGMLVYGASYIPYLSHSNPANITCIADISSFDPASMSWGIGSTPIEMSAACQKYTDEEAVYFDAMTNQKTISLSLANTTSDFTIYVVSKGIAYAAGDSHIMGSVNSWSSSNIINVYHRSGTVWRSSIYGNDADLIDTQNKYVGIAIKSSGMNASWYTHTGAKRLNVPYIAHGTSFTFGSRSGNVYTTDLAVKFVGFVNTGESDETIAANLTELAEQFSLT